MGAWHSGRDLLNTDTNTNSLDVPRPPPPRAAGSHGRGHCPVPVCGGILPGAHHCHHPACGGPRRQQAAGEPAPVHPGAVPRSCAPWHGLTGPPTAPLSASTWLASAARSLAMLPQASTLPSHCHPVPLTTLAGIARHGTGHVDSAAHWSDPAGAMPCSGRSSSTNLQWLQWKRSAPVDLQPGQVRWTRAPSFCPPQQSFQFVALEQRAAQPQTTCHCAPAGCSLRQSSRNSGLPVWRRRRRGFAGSAVPAGALLGPAWSARNDGGHWCRQVGPSGPQFDVPVLPML